MYERNYHDSVLGEDKLSVKKKKKRIKRKTVFILSGCLVFLGIGMTLIFLAPLQVRTVLVKGTNSADPKDVSDFVTESLVGKWLYIFPKTSIVLLPDRTLEHSIQKAFPKFSTVSVTRSGTQTVTVSVTEYEGVYVWCDEGIVACSFMSSTGVVFAPAPFFSGSAYLKLFIGEMHEYPFTPISAEQLANVTFMVERLQAITVAPAEFHFYTAPDRIEIIFYHNGAPARLVLDPNVPADTTLQSFFTAIRTAPFSTRYRDAVSLLEYIDVRLPNKIIYKFQ